MRHVILVVDDEPMVLNIVAAILDSAGFTVLRAASPHEALQLARLHTAPIRLMLSDVVMPGLTGPTLAEAVAELHPETETLFMAGLPDTPEVCERVLARGLAFLPKPFTAKTLLAKVAEVLAAGHPVAAA
jgi:two-component system, cell cycle sensor histidine kinase and response regulator CckA